MSDSSAYDRRKGSIALLRRILKEWDDWYPKTDLRDEDKARMEGLSQAIEEARERLWDGDN